MLVCSGIAQVAKTSMKISLKGEKATLQELKDAWEKYKRRCENHTEKIKN